MKRGTWAILLFAFVVVLAGCSGYSEHADSDHGHGHDEAAGDHGHEHGDGDDDGAKHAMLDATNPAIQTLLAKADSLDGDIDHVIGRCPGCKLGMKGSTEHTMKAGPYEMHFCSAPCRDHFQEKGNEAMLALADPIEKIASGTN